MEHLQDIPPQSDRDWQTLDRQSRSGDAENFLLLCPTHRDDRELSRLARSGANYVRHDYASLALEELTVAGSMMRVKIPDPIEEIERILASITNGAITGVVSTDDYPGSTLATVVAKNLNLPGAEPAVNLICQHKYLSRLAQQALVPEAVPEFVLLDVDAVASLPQTMPLPVFIKPVKSFFSVGAQPIASIEQLTAVQSRWRCLDQFFTPFERLLGRYTGLHLERRYLLAETWLVGKQCTLEGYAFGDEIHFLGAVDSVMFPNTIAFQRFEYPSRLPIPVQDRMCAIARTLMAGLGYRNAMFNIEFIYQPEIDLLSIVEINPRMASQFADLYEKVDGLNSYSVLLDLAKGQKPCLARRAGYHPFAASCVLRSFRDMYVERVPSCADLEGLSLRHPDIRVEVLAAEGRKLSDEMQDGHSFRYGIVSLGGRDRQDVVEKFEECRHQLRFAFRPVSANE